MHANGVQGGSRARHERCAWHGRSRRISRNICSPHRCRNRRQARFAHQQILAHAHRSGRDRSRGAGRSSPGLPPGWRALRPALFFADAPRLLPSMCPGEVDRLRTRHSGKEHGATRRNQQQRPVVASPVRSAHRLDPTGVSAPPWLPQHIASAARNQSRLDALSRKAAGPGPRVGDREPVWGSNGPEVPCDEMNCVSAWRSQVAPDSPGPTPPRADCIARVEFTDPADQTANASRANHRRHWWLLDRA